MTDKTVLFDIRGTIIKINAKDIIESSIDSMIKDLISDLISDINDTIPIVLNEDPAIFHHILNCHKYNLITKPMNIDDNLWKKISDYYNISEPKPVKIIGKYTDSDYYDYFTQNFLDKDNRFDYTTEKDSLANKNATINFCLEKFNKYMPVVFNNNVFIPIHYFNDVLYTIQTYHRFSGIDIGKFSNINVVINDITKYTHTYKNRFIDLLNEIKKKGNFKEDKYLEEAFLAQFD
jgi:hypothetical protein